MESLDKAFETLTNKMIQALDKQDKELADNKRVSSETAKTIDGLTKSLNELRVDMDDRLNKIQANQGGGQQERFQVSKSVGKQFVESDAFKNYVVASGSQRRSAPITLEKSFDSLQRFDYDMKDSYSSAQALSEGFLLPSRITAPNSVNGIMMPLKEGYFFRDLFPSYSTSQNTVYWMKEETWNNNASVVPEFTQDGAQVVTGAQFPAPAGHKYNDGSGNWLTKPRSDFSFSEQQSTMKQIAHYVSITNQALEDLPFLTDWINMKLLDGLAEKIDISLAFGTGAADQLQGFATLAGIQTYTQALGETKLDAIRRAMTQLFVGIYRPSAILLNHYDWAEIELIKDSNENYVWSNPKILGAPPLWGLPVIASNKIPQGEFYMGDFRNGAAIFDRKQVSIRVGEPDDMFLRNLKAVLAELRMGVAYFREDAFLKGTFA